MRNTDDDRATDDPGDASPPASTASPTELTASPTGPHGVYTTALPRRARRRGPLIAGGVGLVALLGVGGVVVHRTADTTATRQHAGAVASAAVPQAQTGAGTLDSPQDGPSSASATSRPARVGSPIHLGNTAREGATAQPPVTMTPPAPMSAAERIKAVQGTAAKANDRIHRPVPHTGQSVVTAADKVTVTESGSLRKDGATLRIVSGRLDLTGQRELTWAADGGRAVGASHCTQSFRFSAGAPAAEKPTLLLCWRTSASRSVLTVATSASGRPSTATSVAAIDRQWAKLG